MSAHSRRWHDHAAGCHLRALIGSWTPLGSALARQQAALAWLDDVLPRQRRHAQPRDHLPRITGKDRRAA